MKTREEFHKLINRLGYKIGIEIGTQRGLFAEYLLEKSNLRFLYAVDAWEWQPNYRDIANVPNRIHNLYYQEAQVRLSRFPGRYSIIKGYSVPTAASFEDETFDFIYIDADHSFAATLADLRVWYPKARVDGMVAGHDYLDAENNCGSNFGVKSAVTEFMRNRKAKVHTTRGPWPSWYMIKKEG